MSDYSTLENPRICTYDGCGRKHYGKGLCHGHYMQRKRGVSLSPIRDYERKAARKGQAPCSFDGCDKPARTGGLCSGHYGQFKRLGVLRPLRPRKAHGTKVPCGFNGCPNNTDGGAHGLCRGHYRQKLAGRELTPLRSVRPASSRDELGRKCCFECDEWKPESSFHKASNQPDGLQTRCARCVRAAALLKRYGVTLDTYDAMLAAQGGGCAICGADRSFDGSSLAVDHDHACCPGEVTCGDCVRGLLCRSCNQGLGNFRDRADYLIRAANYLQSSGS